jgi:hypothetical protein
LVIFIYLPIRKVLFIVKTNLHDFKKECSHSTGGSFDDDAYNHQGESS